MQNKVGLIKEVHHSHIQMMHQKGFEGSHVNLELLISSFLFGLRFHQRMTESHLEYLSEIQQDQS